jgi:hypothetical protein
MRGKRNQRDGRRAGVRRERLPCGCDPAELAQKMGIPIDVLLRAAKNADGASGDVRDVRLITMPLSIAPPHRRGDGFRN